MAFMVTSMNGHLFDLVVPSYAKINLGLYVLGKRPDGYHDIWTIFQQIGFHDLLYFNKHDAPLAVTTTHPDLPGGEGNLVYRAARLLADKCGCSDRVAIHIEKRIPMGAGLGGGSSNAAAALRGMNHLFQLGLTPQELAAFGAELGSDVSYFLHGGTALGTGRGEQIERLPDLPEMPLLLIYPSIHVSSGWAYKNLNLKLTKILLPNKGDLARNDDVAGVLSTLENMLEEPVSATYPIIDSLKSRLVEAGADVAMMSGSGSTVFGIFKEKGLAEYARQQLQRPEWQCIVTSFCSRSRALEFV